jgi:hypothetical protein
MTVLTLTKACFAKLLQSEQCPIQIEQDRVDVPKVEREPRLPTRSALGVGSPAVLSTPEPRFRRARRWP